MMDAPPIIVGKDGTFHNKLTRISPRSKTIDENYLQQLIIKHPSVLPTGEINPDFNDLISLGKEITVRSGSIDALYVTPSGLICIVETKLWRNPEAHRSVLAQVLDYATDLSTMSFQAFSETVTRKQGDAAAEALFSLVHHGKEINDLEFQQSLQETLTHGRFLLLIVGDKIYSDVLLLSDTIRSAPHLEFSIALVELQMYQLGEGENSQILVVPKLIGRTVEETRAVIKIRYEKMPEIEVTTIDDKDIVSPGKTSLREFLNAMPSNFAEVFKPIYDQWIKRNYTISWGTVGFVIRVLNKGKQKTIFEIYPTNTCVFTKKLERRMTLPMDICERFRDRIKKNMKLYGMISGDRSYLYYRDLTSDEYAFLLDELDKTLVELHQYYSEQF